MGCGTAQVYAPHPLASEILSPRPGHDGKLTNRNCLSYQGDTCTKDQVTDYALSDAAFRASANDLKFVCKTGAGKMYQICQDKAGFCRFTSKHTCILFVCWDTPLPEEFIPADPYQRLLDLQIQCFNEEKYSWAFM